MCGIAGIIGSQALSSAQLARLQKAAQAIYHRGPDETGLATTDRVALAHTRLSIIDVLGGQQPLLCPDGRLAAVVNGEVYNHPELSLAFAAKGCKTPRTLSDCESLMLAYATHGIGGFNLLHGMYAGAIHDRAHDTVTLVRDRLGIKPLYYTRQPGFVAFASELKALLPLLDQTPPLRADAITQFLEHEFAAGTGTPFEGIERVPPGTAITFDANLNARTESYWNLRDVQPVATERRRGPGALHTADGTGDGRAHAGRRAFRPVPVRRGRFQPPVWPADPPAPASHRQLLGGLHGLHGSQ
jgi:asparagine synthase (glutamine-hydrolysing)